MKRSPLIWAILGTLTGLLVAGSFWLTRKADRHERETAETVLGLRAQGIARHVNAWKPDYDQSFQIYSGANRGQMLVVLYDLAGNEPGRSSGTKPLLPLNEFAVRLVWPTNFRPLHGEAPLPHFPAAPPELAVEPRFENRFFATNSIGSSWVTEMKLADGQPWLVATTPVNDYDEGTKSSFISAWIQAAIPVKEVERASQERRLWLAAFWLVAGAMVALGYRTSLRQGRSLDTAAVTAEQLPLERLATTRLPEPADDSQGARLVRACNRLLDRVAEVHAAQLRFVADASHELRTPLTILRGEIQVALREPANHPLLVETLRSSLDEAVHLSRLVDSLLTLARADAGQAISFRQSVELAPLVTQTLGKLESLAEKQHVRLELSVPDTAKAVVLMGDPVALERILFNLVDNAVKHSPPGHAVTVLVEAGRESVRLMVKDRGIGIGPEHLPRLFDRFYRVDAARRRADGRMGLGLAIVKTLTEAHGGSVSVRSEVGEGSTFTVELPLAGQLT